MRLIDADELYKRTAEWEEQAQDEVNKNKGCRTIEEWDKYKEWLIILNERSSFKYDVADAPTIEAEMKWIPCSERMPKEEDRFLVTINLTNGYVLPFIKILSYGFPEDGKVRDKMCFYTYDCEFGDIEYDNDRVLAWMPLPEPYKEQKDG